MMTFSINTGSLMLDTLSSDALQDVLRIPADVCADATVGSGVGQVAEAGRSSGGSRSLSRRKRGAAAGGGGLSAAEDAQRSCGTQLVVTKLQTVANFVSLVSAGAPSN